MILGATGRVGSEVLHQCLGHRAVTLVVAVGRSAPPVTHDKLEAVHHADFTDFDAIGDYIESTNCLFYCIGVYQGSVPSAEFWAITCDYLEALVRAVERRNPKMSFCLFSARGADPSERMPVLFAKAKGRAERIPLNSAVEEAYAFRPGHIKAGPHARHKKVWYEALVDPLYRLYPGLGVDATDLARVMLQAAVHGHSRKVFENPHIRALARELDARL
jgi:nucleoside-diphosphate-sugar epimerase